MGNCRGIAGLQAFFYNVEYGMYGTEIEDVSGGIGESPIAIVRFN